LRHDILAETVNQAFGSVDRDVRQNGCISPEISAGVDVIHKDLEQVHMIMGCPAPSSISPDRYPAFLLNAVLGGSMSSRLFQEIREKRGLAYAIHSYLCAYQDAGMLGIYVGTPSLASYATVASQDNFSVFFGFFAGNFAGCFFGAEPISED
jgi:predicted Zn-dependent peptidase